MAGSFGVFRQYEKAALAGLAIMAMLAFFVLPPFLQMGGGGGGRGADPTVVSWNGGDLRESGLQREVIRRKVMNQFLIETLRASGQDPSRIRLADDEKDVVDTLLLAKEAERNGIVVSNAMINQFLGEWTNGLVPSNTFEGIIAGIGSRIGISPEDVFDTIRTSLLARRMESLLLGGVGFEGAPPGWRWDFYRRLEQGATIEAVPLVVEQFVDKLPEPSEAALRGFFEQHKNELPEARSADPGFRQPHRVRYDYLVAKAGTFEEEEKKKVTDEQVRAFYDDRKAALYKVKPADAPADAASSGAQDKKEAPPAEAPAAGSDPAATSPAPASKEGASSGRVRAIPTAFRQPAAAATSTVPAAPAAPATTAPPAATGSSDTQTEPAAAGADTAAAGSAAAEFEPLEKVRDDIVDRLAREAVERRVTAIFEAVKTDVAKYGESLALWEVAGEGAGPAPTGPDVKKIAATQGLDGGGSDLVNASEAFADGGIGGSFEFSISRETGVRQQRWIDMMFGAGSQSLQAFTSRDVDGNRYLSWKTEDQPEFTPSFQSSRDDVLRAWRIVEARPLARKAAEDLAAEAKAGTTLDQVASARGSLEVQKVGPFTWLTRGTAPFGSAPELSQPSGLMMPGEELMRAVFSLEPGQATVAFNEPKTVCYALRLVSLEPDDARLKELFLASMQDPRRLAAVAEDDMRGVYDAWLKSILERNAVSWKREPRGTEPR